MAKSKPVKTFHIIQEDRTLKLTFDVTIESDETKFKSLEHLMTCITRHYLDKGRVDEIDWLLSHLQEPVENHEERFEITREV